MACPLTELVTVAVAVVVDVRTIVQLRFSGQRVLVPVAVFVVVSVPVR
jgi:hypothetical protein